MSTTQDHQDTATETMPAISSFKFEVVVIPVSDVDRSMAFYQRLGWRLDADFAFENGFRVVQLTPPDSATSVQFGTKISAAAPGSAEGLYLVVPDIDAAHDDLLARGVIDSGVFHPAAPGAQFRPGATAGREPGRAPDGASYGSFLTFDDPDGNTWLVQEITTRLPGRVTTATSYASVEELSQALQRVAAAHGEHEARNGGEFDEQWPDWYASYLVAEQSGEELPT
jgi:catechol 2,3-dioxygenase-like lactoylglutathione lyase family enzyme